MENIFFADDTNIDFKASKNFDDNWKIIIADDEEDIHTVTKLVLKNVEFEEKPIEFISCFNDDETKNALKKHSDAAIILLDVVMDTLDSGLKITKYIREELKNRAIRIILRTGQAGTAPERNVIINYDINDYKEKTELTSQKLFTTVISSLRGYKDIRTIEHSKNGLEKIIKSSSKLFSPNQKMKNFAELLLEELSSLIDSSDSMFYFQPSSFMSFKDNNSMKIVAATGNFFKYIGLTIDEMNDILLKEKLTDLDINNNFIINKDEFFGCFESINESKSIIYFKDSRGFSNVDKNLLKIFSTNVSTALDNFFLNEEIINTQKEIITTLGEVVETRSKETHHHVKRVADFSYFLALKYGLSKDECEILRAASPMHDIGKIGIPEQILNKPSKLTKDEFELIKKHTIIGYDILSNSNREILKAASIISNEHHEKWDGTGYPKGLKGEEIHIYGRITAICDVFDALSHKRVYKEAWPIEKVINYILSEKGRHFDPKLVDLFIENIDYILKIKNTNKDYDELFKF
ncbi:response regulator RpfG family c-di-GMP phosphodiesterase [Hypnocyclicus thermotrophus]|uniref:Response regulator RpfG family c-di-GMP phosphodiesterase n=1 Tax=Hypnocyclicus thermotrophus TaxID=1627895 RepID=A0AA46E046_9FUSO|nr:response regulator [Hypnocyclicus thermotrophus]TDT72246.1 response regulator RpfG family c-di-GMP phosphodiesterase [Hypnocyclicus thermotrophus]